MYECVSSSPARSARDATRILTPCSGRYSFAQLSRHAGSGGGGGDQAGREAPSAATRARTVVDAREHEEERRAPVLVARPLGRVVERELVDLELVARAAALGREPHERRAHVLVLGRRGRAAAARRAHHRPLREHGLAARERAQREEAEPLARRRAHLEVVAELAGAAAPMLVARAPVGELARLRAVRALPALAAALPLVERAVAEGARRRALGFGRAGFGRAGFGRDGFGRDGFGRACYGCVRAGFRCATTLARADTLRRQPDTRENRLVRKHRRATLRVSRDATEQYLSDSQSAAAMTHVFRA